MADNMQIAKTILDQLGGNKFKAMTGAANLMAIENGLVFSIKGCRKINKVRIVLNQMDTYNVEFLKIPNVLSGKEVKVVSKAENIYCDQLCAVFENETGLRTRLF